jgi:hypothetical protein
MIDITVIIPSKHERYLFKTVADIQDAAESNIEVLVGRDEKEEIGQRAQMNKLARMAKGKYIMKTDAHCSFGAGFDAIMLEQIKDNQIMAPLMLPLDAEKWTVSPHNKMGSFAFDTQLVNHHVPLEGKKFINKTMCLQGSCFLTLRDNYWNWNLCDESLGSWGQGVELGIQAHKHGGECVTTRSTYYGHLFRHGEEDFPYKRKQAEIDKCHQKVVKKLKRKEIAGLIEEFDYPLDWNKKAVKALK